MKSSIKTFGVLLAAAVATATVVKADDKPPAATNAPATKAPKIEDFLPDAVIAKGKGVEIKRSQLDDEMTRIKASVTASRGQEIPPAELPMIEVKMLDGLILGDILRGKATDEEKAKGKEEAEKRFETIKKNAPSQETLLLQLKSMGLTLDTLHRRLVEESTSQAVLRSKIKVTDEEVKKFYEDNPSKFEQPEMVRASHILLMTKDAAGTPLSDDEKKAKKKQIEGILKRARDGEDFAKLAKEYSEDPGSKDNGGEYKFPRGQMVSEFESAAFSMKTNQISEVITTQFGYHIIKLSEKIPAKKIDFAEASPSIKSYLENAELEKLLPKLGPQLKKEAGVEILDEKLKALDESLMAANAAEMNAAPDAKPKAPAK
jgi:peptidyl-prolyl cis-trans isomerase C